jgi:hypothetical protein
MPAPDGKQRRTDGASAKNFFACRLTSRCQIDDPGVNSFPALMKYSKKDGLGKGGGCLAMAASARQRVCFPQSSRSHLLLN